MWPGTANSGGWRSPQASAATPKNTRDPAQTGKKKPQLLSVRASVLVEAAGVLAFRLSEWLGLRCAQARRPASLIQWRCSTKSRYL